MVWWENLCQASLAGQNALKYYYLVTMETGFKGL